MTELLDITLLEAVFALVVVFAASVARGYSGFGFSAVLVAGLRAATFTTLAVLTAALLLVKKAVVRRRRRCSSPLGSLPVLSTEQPQWRGWCSSWR